MSIPQPDLRQLLATAINEQGFLFQQRVYEEARRGVAAEQHSWVLAAMEVPVSVPDGRGTRVDIVLRHISAAGIHLAIECKRANPKYKAWAFFGRDESVQGAPAQQYYFERFRFSEKALGRAAGVINHGLLRTAAEKPVFNHYVEARIDLPGTKKSGQPRAEKCSSTESIEEALTQVAIGQKGVFDKLRAQEELSPVVVIPVVVTSADLYELKFDLSDVCLRRGVIDAGNVNPESIPFAVVNFRVSDGLAAKSEHNIQHAWDLAHELIHFQLRTVFVVQSEGLRGFLQWVGDGVLSAVLRAG